MIKSLSVKNRIFQFATLKNAIKKNYSSGTEGPVRNTRGTRVVVTLFVGLLRVDDPWSAISVLIKTRPTAKLLSWQRCDR